MGLVVQGPWQGLVEGARSLAQLAKLDEWVEARTRNAAIFADALSDVRGIRLPLPEPRFRHAFYKLYFYLDGEGDPAPAREAILRRAEEERLKLFSGSCSEVYREEAFADLPAPDLPVARELGRSSLMVEVHPTLRPDLTRRRAERLAAILREVLG
jgi:dTDP-4-amino-4,6-dideoxygalactose transaminase